MKSTSRAGQRVPAIACIALFAGLAHAQPASTTYSVTKSDCVTGPNAFAFAGSQYWTVTPGCDTYQIDTYERPTTSEYQTVAGMFAAKEYSEFLDIASSSFGFDSQYLYVRIELLGRNLILTDFTQQDKGLVGRYGFRFSTDPDGRFGTLIVADQPELKNAPSTVFGPLGVFGYEDTNGDVGGAASSGPTGLSVTKSDNPLEEQGMNGYDLAIIQDGSLGTGQPIAWVRTDSPSGTVVELALDYIALGYTNQQIQNLAYFDVEAVKGGPSDPQNYLFNDKHTKQEAGSPNPGQGGMSEFGTPGLQDVLEVDTLRLADAPACIADFNGDGVLNIFDYIAFGNAYAAGSLTADINGDGVLNIFDYIAFGNLYAAGC